MSYRKATSEALRTSDSSQELLTTVEASPAVLVTEAPLPEGARRRRRSRSRFVLLVTLPALVITVGVLIPFVLSIYYSFTNKSFNTPTFQFVGLSTWKMALTSPDFGHGIQVTLEYAVFATVLETVVGVGIALLMQRKSLLTSVARTVTLLPLLISESIAVIIWDLLTNPTYGPYPHWLGDIGIHTVFANNPGTALPTVILIDFWLYTPFIIILASAGLNSLPKEPFEAAEVDGGSWWFTFRRLTLPMVKPVLIIAVLFRFMAALGEFTIIYGLTAGGPGNTLMNLTNVAYQDGFLYFNFAEAMVFLLVLWAMVFILSEVLVHWYQRGRQDLNAAA